MKSQKYKLFMLLALAFSSCDNSLDLNPLDQISTSTFWKTKSDFDKALTANYASMQADPWAVELPVWNCLTDDGFAQHNSGAAKEITSGSISPSTGGYVSGVYSESYKAIARVNIFLAQLKAYANPDVTETDRKLYEAETRFLRAFYYFQLYHLYGDVPLVLEPLTLETQNQPKVPAAEILAQINADLDFAIANLNANAYPQNGGHAAASSAQALKARVLMYAAYGENGTPDAAILAQVKALATEIMLKYSLSPNFEDVFRDAGQKNNPEIIFSTNFLAPNNTRPWDMYYGDWLVASPLQNFVDAFECTDGLPYGVSPLTDKKEPFKNRDPRLAKTVFVDHPDFGGGRVHIPSNSRPSGYGVLKFLEPGNIPFGYSTLSQQNAVVLRLADVLLMYAEAQNELAGPDATVYRAINDVRLRSKMPALPAGLTKAQMREKIRHERRIELAFEGLRYYDLKRWHIAGEVLNSVKDSFVPYKFEDKFYKWPIPQPEIDKSGGVLKQNEDYL
ncbi:RagB/SusD family nutrient uptake outer membrane protein [Dyadobacter fermentans]|uniref:RagB/SusD domain protein n=1 Tax=Dyadobacter fermentans (strain ATCC 700827 / DSM 18053 / CIP 107007 / KCTC 52180 / NS114) TaxID=471854 RepID=C6VUV7_DYAFD|nr:RagB/SusD family nutrient uptake outer membrane protein [Dyadobacter fermentans]ACT93094.1 RagB/SusD domain protein [Dyadobacter fermentans DSM 18053]